MVTTDVHEEIEIPGGSFNLPGELEIPQNANALVLFSHGSGSSRFSPRNQKVALTLRENGIGTFLFDLLDSGEDSIETRFDIHLLTKRLLFVTKWILRQSFTKGMNVGFFGASTGAASALNAAAGRGDTIKAVVSRGGRPDLAMSALGHVKSATLLIVGELDDQVLQLNEKAYDVLPPPKKLVIVPGATHLFEEPGKLEAVSDLASEWFKKFLS